MVELRPYMQAVGCLIVVRDLEEIPADELPDRLRAVICKVAVSDNAMAAAERRQAGKLPLKDEEITLLARVAHAKYPPKDAAEAKLISDLHWVSDGASARTRDGILNAFMTAFGKEFKTRGQGFTRTILTAKITQYQVDYLLRKSKSAADAKAKLKEILERLSEEVSEHARLGALLTYSCFRRRTTRHGRRSSWPRVPSSCKMLYIKQCAFVSEA
jgi:hypothetical protein